MLHFTKMHGAGNDFILMDNRIGNIHLARAAIAQLCDRHRGVGADGLMLLERQSGNPPYFMRYYNSDGGQVEMCGNGARCFARFAQRLLGEACSSFLFDTVAGEIEARFEGELVRLKMSQPKDLVLNQKIELDTCTLTIHSINTGVPHVVVFIEGDLAEVPVTTWGRQIRQHQLFHPSGTNANFVSVTSQGDAGGGIEIRTYERGVEGETLACGTGVVAAALLANAVKGLQAPISVAVQGGDQLQVNFQAVNGQFEEIYLTGAGVFVFDGTVL